MIQKNSVVGRTIVGFDPGPFDDGRGGTAHDPVLMLDNGVRLAFVVMETESDYGVDIVARKPNQSQRAEAAEAFKHIVRKWMVPKSGAE